VVVDLIVRDRRQVHPRPLQLHHVARHRGEPNLAALQLEVSEGGVEAPGLEVATIVLERLKEKNAKSETAD